MYRDTGKTWIVLSGPMLSGVIWTVRIQDFFKTILYKKTVDNKVKPLGNEKNPEKATKNSLRAYGDYVYYLRRWQKANDLLFQKRRRNGVMCWFV